MAPLSAQRGQCLHSSAAVSGLGAAEVIKEFDSHIALFPGKTQAEVTRMLCNAVDDDGDLVYEDFMEAFTPEVRAEAEVVFARCAT